MKLYIVHLGFYDNDIGMYELHSNILVVASDVKSVKQIVKSKEFFISKNMHIDGIQEIINVDGYDIIVSKKKDSLQTNKIFDHLQVKAL